MDAPRPVRAEPVEAPSFFGQRVEEEERHFDKLSANGVGWLPSNLGMTLVEMLVVLAIIGVAAGAVTLGIGSATRAPSVESEARRFASRLQAAADDAMLGDRMVALTASEDGYGFASVEADGSIPSGTPRVDFHQLPGGMAMTLSARPPFILGLDGAAKPLTATIESGDQRWVVRYDGLTALAASAPTQ